VPWLARPALARAGTLDEAYKLLEKYSGPDAELTAEYDAMPSGPLWRDASGYAARLSAWRSGVGAQGSTTTRP